MYTYLPSSNPVQRGAHVDHTDVHGNTLLHAATSSGNASVVQFALSTILPHSLFSLNERNKYGETALELATLKGWWMYILCVVHTLNMLTWME